MAIVGNNAVEPLEGPLLLLTANYWRAWSKPTAPPVLHSNITHLYYTVILHSNTTQLLHTVRQCPRQTESTITGRQRLIHIKIVIRIE